MTKKHEPKANPFGVTRSFLKHKVFGTLYAVDRDAAGVVVAAVSVTSATACRHMLDTYELTPDFYAINKEIRDYAFFEPTCSDPAHWLQEIGAQEKLCSEAEGEWLRAKSHAKELREAYEQEKAALRTLCREATTAPALPLFDHPADEPPAADPPAPEQPSA